MVDLFLDWSIASLVAAVVAFVLSVYIHDEEPSCLAFLVAAGLTILGGMLSVVAGLMWVWP